MGGIGSVLAGVGSIVGAVAGGGGGGGTSVSNIETLTPRQRELLDFLAEEQTKEFQREVLPYPGQLTAGLSDLQQQAISRLGTLDQYTASPERALQTFQTAVGDPARQNFLKELVPGIQAKFNALGAGSSSGLNRALATAATDLETNLASQRAGFVYDAERQGLSDQINLASLQGTFGDLQRQIEQQDISAQLSEWMRINQLPRPAFSIAGNPLAVSAFEPLVESTQPAVSPLAGLASTIGYGLGSGGMFGNLFGNSYQSRPLISNYSSPQLGGYSTNFSLPNFLQGVF